MKKIRDIRPLLPRAAEFHMVLSDVNRLRMIRILSTEKDVTVSEVAKRLGISQPAVSQHLRILKMTGLLVPDRRGNQTIYRINMECLKEYRNLENDMYEVILASFKESEEEKVK